MKTQTTFFSALASLATLTSASPAPLKARQGVEVTCQQPNFFRAQKSGFQDFINAIPDEEWDLNTASLPLGFANGGNGARVANLRRACGDCGDIARGGDIRDMLNQGYEQCVESGENDAGDGAFWNFLVSNGGYTINAGGGTAAGTFGTDGTYIFVSV